MSRSEDLEQWAKGQTRITNKQIRVRFDVDEATATEYYDYLKSMGRVGRMGYVEKERI